MLAGVVLGLSWILATGACWGKLQAALYLMYMEVFPLRVGRLHTVATDSLALMRLIPAT